MAPSRGEAHAISPLNLNSNQKCSTWRSSARVDAMSQSRLDKNDTGRLAVLKTYEEHLEESLRARRDQKDLSAVAAGLVQFQNTTVWPRTNSKPLPGDIRHTLVKQQYKDGAYNWCCTLSLVVPVLTWGLLFGFLFLGSTPVEFNPEDEYTFCDDYDGCPITVHPAVPWTIPAVVVLFISTFVWIFSQVRVDISSSSSVYDLPVSTFLDILQHAWTTSLG